MNTTGDTASIAATGMLGAVGQMLDDGLLVADADGALISANAAAVRFLGEGLVGKQLAEVIARDEVADLVAGRTSSCTRTADFSKPFSVFCAGALALVSLVLTGDALGGSTMGAPPTLGRTARLPPRG